MQRLAAAALLLLLLFSGVEADRFIELPTSIPCYTGVAELELVDNDCPELLQPLTNLSTPFEPQFHVPWDCLNSMLVSVEGCVVSMVSQLPMSETLFNFSCSWMQLQGNLVDETHARMSSWLRPSPVARYVLTESDLEVVAADLTNPPRVPGWQLKLAELIRESSMLVADPQGTGLPDQVVLEQFGGQCATTFKVKSGGVMGVGTVNSSSVGMIVLPSTAPFTPPFVIRGQRPQPWAPRRDVARAVVVALAIMVGVFCVTLLSCLGFLVYRLVKAGRVKRSSHISTTPFEDGVGRYDVGLGPRPAPQQEIGQGAVSLEHQARRHGSTGGL